MTQDRQQEREHIGAAKALAKLGGRLVDEADNASRMFVATKVLEEAARHAGAAAVLLVESERGGSTRR